MDPCEHHLFVTFFTQLLHFPQDVFTLSTAHSSSSKWNNAITTKLITTILNFNKRSCVITNFTDK